MLRCECLNREALSLNKSPLCDVRGISSSVVRFVRVVLHVRLFDDGVLVIIRVILGVLVRLWDMVVEGRECWGIWAAHVWPEPPVSHWLLILEDWIALVNEG